MTEWLLRYRDAPLPFQTWNPFPPEAIVEIKGAYDDYSKIGPASKFWWGYEDEFGSIGEGVITRARRLDKNKE